MRPTKRQSLARIAGKILSQITIPFLLVTQVEAQSTTPAVPPDQADAGAAASTDAVTIFETAPVYTEQDRTSRRVTFTRTKQSRATGELFEETSSYVEVASGLNYRDANGEWKESLEQFNATPDGGFAAELGLHRLRLGPNLNALPSVELATEDGLLLRSAPLAVGYFDPV